MRNIQVILIDRFNPQPIAIPWEGEPQVEDRIELTLDDGSLVVGTITERRWIAREQDPRQVVSESAALLLHVSER